MLVIHVKGLASEAEVGNVMISQELENNVPPSRFAHG